MSTQHVKPLKELNLTDRFLYDAVMEDEATVRAALSIIFGREIPLLTRNEAEKEYRVSPLARSIRMDIVSFDAEGNVYDSEMQGKRKADLPKRSRYYQPLLDAGLLEPGITDYNALNDSYIIIITPFDLFGYEKYRYTFVPKCEEIPELRLSDGATRIFLNTRGTNEDEVPKELVDFLRYIEESTDENVARSDSESIREIHRRVCKVKESEEIGMRYLRELEEKNEAIQSGIEQGDMLRLISLVQKKIARGKNLETSADELEMQPGELESIYQAVRQNPDKSAGDILQLLTARAD